MVRCITLLCVLVLSVSCKPDEEAIAKRVLELSRNQGKAPVESVTTEEPSTEQEGRSPTDSQELPFAKVTQAPSDVQEKLQDSYLFVDSLSALMSGFDPALPEVSNNNLLRCVTQEARTFIEELKTVEKKFAKKEGVERKAREKARKEFFDRVYPVHFRVDHQWRSRPGGKMAARYGCWDRCDNFWDKSAAYRTKGGCQDHHCNRWRLRSRTFVEDPSVNLYSGNTEPSKPELMRRLASEDLDIPGGLSCLVGEVSREKRNTGKLITVVNCLGPNGHRSFEVNLHSEAWTKLNIGDVIQVPLANIKGFEKGVLYAEFHGNSGAEIRSWVVESRGFKKTYENQSCASNQELYYAMCDVTNARSDKKAAISYCIWGKNVPKLKEHLKRWERRGDLRKDTLVAAYKLIVSQEPHNLEAVQRLARHEGRETASPARAASAGRTDGSGGIDTGGGTGVNAGLGRKRQRRVSKFKIGSGSAAGFCSKKNLSDVVRRRAGALRACYEKRLQVKPSLQGKIVVRWRIGLDGKVETANLSSSSLNDTPVHSCILRTIRRMRFAKPEGGVCIVQWPFVFRSGG